MTAVLGIVAALEMERRWIASPESLVELSGVGDEKAEAAARRLLERGATALVSWGVAGGLDSASSPGTVVLPDAVICADGPKLRVDREWRDRLLACVRDQVVTTTTPIYHAMSVIGTVEEKSDVHKRFGAGAVDMESGAVGRVALENNIPWIVVRAVVDPVDVVLPAAIQGVTGEDGRLRAGAVFGLILRPGLWPQLISLRQAAGAAERSMRRVWIAARPDLALS